ncbi:MAG: ATP-binding cassette domain-containing protein, partial [Bacteroidota bacterium]
YNKPALRSVDLTIPHGKVTAIVGASGSGKTTLLKLLLGYYVDFTGEVQVGQTPFRKMDIAAWRECCGVILQESYLFDETIERNVILGQELDPDRFARAVAIANLAEFIEDLPRGYQTPIGREGKGLSMGQKQRILMARAVYKDPDYFFMDEATNSLDADNESLIMDGLRRFFHGRTVLIVAHRLSTIQFADNIVVMHKGELVEQGTHAELVAGRGKYFELINKQMQ